MVTGEFRKTLVNFESKLPDFPKESTVTMIQEKLEASGSILNFLSLGSIYQSHKHTGPK